MNDTYNFQEDTYQLSALFDTSGITLDEKDESAIKEIHNILMDLLEEDNDKLQELITFPISRDSTSEPETETKPGLKRKSSPQRLPEKQLKRSKEESETTTWQCTCDAQFNGKQYSSLFRHIGKHHIKKKKFECPYSKDCNVKPCKRPSQVIHHLINEHKSFTICCKTMLLTQHDIEEHKDHIKMNQRNFKNN